MKIKSIKVKNVRGIKDLELELNGKSLLLYGENGTGKSSLVDAFELFFTNGIEHITNVKNLSLKKHCPHIQSKYEDVAVTVEFDPGPISITRTLSKKIIIPNNVIDYFTNIHQSKFILRRDHILEFIYSPPSKRYEAIGELIGIKSLNDIEATLLKVCDYFEREFRLKENAISTIVSFISQYLGVASLDQKNILDSLNRVLEKEGLENLKSFETMDEYIKDLMRFVRDKSKHSSISEKLIVLFNSLSVTGGHGNVLPQHLMSL